MPTAVITGASQGLGRALATDLAAAGWTLVLDARTAPALDAVARELGPDVMAIPGDVTDPEHRYAIAAVVGGRLDLLVLNASALGPSPLPPLSELGTAELRDVLETNVVAPHALLRLLLPALRAATGRVLTLSSDAAVAAYPGWGGYGASKAALDQLAAVLGAEEPLLLVYAVDPGDMRTAMHAAAFPGEDISDRPEPETVIPALRRLIDGDLPNGRYEAATLLAAPAPAAPAPAGPAPAGPASVGPAPADPAPAGLASDHPSPASPASAGPAPAGLASDHPAPAGPAPAGPAPVGPAPAGLGSDRPAPAGSVPGGSAPAGLGSDGPAPAGSASDGPAPAVHAPGASPPAGPGPGEPAQEGGPVPAQVSA